ncbi:hypothetical protein ABTX80_24940 [Streptomyces erythrochromogenes]|uniref:hypothetical protein n=1 Tax=Streptomyces erythrochromogenes TaxID=285574 RepID=UPI0033223588
MTAASYPVIRCDGSVHCVAEAQGPPGARTVTEVRRHNAGDWHARPGGRDICPDCWKGDYR